MIIDTNTVVLAESIKQTRLTLATTVFLTIFESVNGEIGAPGLKAVEFAEPVSGFLGHPLDHVYYSEHLEVEHAQALRTFSSSDHYPLLVRFAFSPLG